MNRNNDNHHNNRKRGKGRSNRSRPGANADDTTVEVTTPTNVLADNSLLSRASFALNQIGVANLNRTFVFDSDDTAPHIMFKTAIPMAGFMLGFTATDIADQDQDAATDVSKGIDDPLYPVTVTAQNFEDEIFPVILTLLEGGTGSRHIPSFSSVVRYFAMTMRVMIMMKQILALNTLTYHTDWKDVFPFTDDIPKPLYDISKFYDATDIGLADRWAPYIRRIENLVMFPEIIKAINEITAPYVQRAVGGRVVAPVWSALDVEVFEEDMGELLRYIEIDLSKTNSVLKSFLPFPIGDQSWMASSLIFRNVDLDSAAYNSGYRPYSIFGDTNDPSADQCMTFEANSDIIYFNSATDTPLFAEIMMAKVYEIFPDATDDEYALLSVHSSSGMIIIDDEGTRWEWYSTNTSARSEQLSNIINDRYYFNNYRGILNAGTTTVTVPYDAMFRLVKLYGNFLFSRPALAEVSKMAAGASLKQVKEAIHSVANR